MRYAIVESGGKQYRAVEGEVIEVDRLPDEEGKHIELRRVLMMADGSDFVIGAPTLSGIDVKVTVLEHFGGRKVTHFKYSPKKRIRVRGGHRPQYTRLMVDFIGSKGETRRIEKAEPKPEKAEAETKDAASGGAEPAASDAPRKRAEKKAAIKKQATVAKKPSPTTGKKMGK